MVGVCSVLYAQSLRSGSVFEKKFFENVAERLVYKSVPCAQGYYLPVKKGTFGITRLG
jgi:hypothetical protein